MTFRVVSSARPLVGNFRECVFTVLSQTKSKCRRDLARRVRRLRRKGESHEDALVRATFRDPSLTCPRQHRAHSDWDPLGPSPPRARPPPRPGAATSLPRSNGWLRPRPRTTGWSSGGGMATPSSTGWWCSSSTRRRAAGSRSRPAHQAAASIPQTRHRFGPCRCGRIPQEAHGQRGGRPFPPIPFLFRHSDSKKEAAGLLSPLNETIGGAAASSNDDYDDDAGKYEDENEDKNDAYECLWTVDGAEAVLSATLAPVAKRGIYSGVTLDNEFLVVNGVVASPFILAHGIVDAKQQGQALMGASPMESWNFSL